MPADRELLEKKLRKVDTILLRTEYKYVSSVGTLHFVGRSVIVQDWQTATSNIIKAKKEFKRLRIPK